MLNLSLKYFFVILMLVLTSNCAYRWGQAEKKIPGGYYNVSIPIFENKTSEVGIESFFSNALRQEFMSSRVARLSYLDQAEVEIKGRIVDVSVVPNTLASAGKGYPGPPQGTAPAIEYKVVVKIGVSVIRRSDFIKLWEESFTGEQNFNAAHVYTSGLSSVNPLYDLNAKRESIKHIAIELMSEVHNTMTESF